ncbi:MAG: peptide chain release factor-like protein [Candidatus Aminicenantes bacterium]|nr:MAG: peptide chain release factor-like protein [Candidatus Aminicenantes bacterium]
MKKLLFTITKKDFDIQTFRSGGKGGQHQNKVESGVRIIHRASGAVGESRTDRSQHRNRRFALERLTKSVKFKIWLNQMVHELTSGKTIEERVNEAMAPENLRIEMRGENGEWSCEESIGNKS